MRAYAAARYRLVASSHSAAGRSTGFIEMSAATSTPTTAGRSRYRQQSARPSADGSVTLPVCQPLMTGAVSSTSP